MKSKRIAAKEIQLIVYDFDGVMTNNTAQVDENGVESVIVSRGDGMAVDMIRKKNIPQMIISTEENKVVAARARKLEIQVIQNCPDKKSALIAHCRSEGIDLKKVLYVGNDVNDLAAMQSVGHRVCPADSHPSIKKVSQIITKARGGAGVIRELADILKIPY